MLSARLSAWVMQVLYVCVRSDLFAVRHVAGQQQDLRGGERGRQRQAVLLLADLLSVSVHPLLRRAKQRSSFKKTKTTKQSNKQKSEIFCFLYILTMKTKSAKMSWAQALLLKTSCSEFVCSRVAEVCFTKSGNITPELSGRLFSPEPVGSVRPMPETEVTCYHGNRLFERDLGLVQHPSTFCLSPAFMKQKQVQLHQTIDHINDDFGETLLMCWWSEQML